ncbi:relaxase/mobilization nuclease domain-containing protein [Teredinibacter turnerae]|uniref:relaxase/mobilization nuclease domain-containing protein n=1 Tax=Teredinibacter turnerae TaxID=2426 RepID=UPI0003747BD4|nr:relaxase/mobilization nuclease domain-containing protein [Teredinibacter turnerae]
MILKGSQRSGGKQLAAHLLKTEDNEHVEVHELRGFMSEDLPSAFNEVHAVSKGTRARQPFFSLSLSPPPNERVPIEVFETAIEQIEQKLGLENQPRVVVFHEKEGRRHAHVVWSRIDTDEMKAINLPFYKMKLKDLSRELYLEHGWKIPPGIVDRKDRNPLNFSREEWQQARRVGLNPKEVKRTFQECWAISDNCNAFSQALHSKGFVLARGDRRGFVAVDYRGETYAIARYTGVKTKEARDRLGDPKTLPSIEQTKAKIAVDMSQKLQQHLADAEATKTKRSAAFEFKRQRLVEEQRKERQLLEQSHNKRWDTETKERSQRLSKGLMGIWHRLTCKYEKTKRQNELDALVAFQRDRQEKDELIFKHIQQRQQLSLRQRSEIHTHELEIELLRQDIEDYRDLKTAMPSKLKEEFRNASEKVRKTKKMKKYRDNDRGYEPEL